MTSEELMRQPCPGCGGRMDHGYIAGHWVKLRWVRHNHTMSIFEGTAMKSKAAGILSAPSIEAVRCRSCRIGVFVYDE